MKLFGETSCAAEAGLLGKAKMTKLSLALLGPFQATIYGEPIPGLTSGKARALLAYLAVEADRPHSAQGARRAPLARPSRGVRQRQPAPGARPAAPGLGDQARLSPSSWHPGHPPVQPAERLLDRRCRPPSRSGRGSALPASRGWNEQSPSTGASFSRLPADRQP